ncbi:hypothetical protein CEXT_418811 [Caerostris extrusa]|uniref:NHR domain-containing protein n=1 Tax=Caerostris extrusa TaxID=172846 RepID=A0AAV4RWZ4_CAEEX|nr:hypothetical protein CEXT_418811 [Caerostris extrusa]
MWNFNKWKGKSREYGEYNLDELHEGDRIGLVRKSNKSLNYYINGFDQGIAAENVPDVLYGVVDLYGMTVKVSITDNYKPTLNKPDQENCTAAVELRNKPYAKELDYDMMICYFITIVDFICLDDFNNAVVITNRPLKHGEIFEVLLEQVVMKWEGTIEVGVTIHSAEELKFPSTMTVVRSGTWMMTRNGVMYNGSTITDDYGYDLDKLKAGDKAVKASIVGSSESPVFYEDVNSPTATNYLEDLQMSQSSSIGGRKNSQAGKETEHANEISKPLEPPFSFYSVRGTNISLDYFGVLATRTRDYDHGLVFSLKYLKKDHLYEVHVYTTNTIWGGTLRFGVTTYEPENQTDLPSSALGLTDCDTWLILDSHLYKNGEVLKRNYALYLPHVTAGDSVGIKIFNDNSLHFFINGVDLGVAELNMPEKLRMVADIYGSVESVMAQNGGAFTNTDSRNQEKNLMCSQFIYAPFAMMAFHENHGKNILLSNENLTACRTAGYNQGIVITYKALLCEEIFQIQLDNLLSDWSGSIQIGVTSQNPGNIMCLPSSALSVKENTWVISEDSVYYNGVKIKSKYGPHLNNLKNRHKIGVKIDSQKNLHLIVNNIDHGIAAENISYPAFAIIDVYGKCKQRRKKISGISP